MAGNEGSEKPVYKKKPPQHSPSDPEKPRRKPGQNDWSLGTSWDSRIQSSYELGSVTNYGTTLEGWRRDSSDVSTFRRLLPQVIASLACNFVLLDLNLSLAFPTIVIAKLYQNKEDPLSLDDHQATWIGSIAYICQPFGSLSSGLLVEWLGRKRFMMLLNVPFLAAWILLYTAPSYVVLCLAEVIVGITIGLTEAPINSYIGEVCQPEIRGMMTACAGVFYQFGFFLEYLLGSLLPWRTAAAISASIPIMTALLIAIAPEAPIWLISKGRKQEAEKALCWLRGWVEPSAVREELEELTRYHKETQLLLTAPKRKPAVSTISGNIQVNCMENPSYIPEMGEDKEQQNGSPRHTATEEDPESESGGVHCCGRRVEMLDRMRDLLRLPTLRPLFLVIPYFFFVHWSGMTSIRPFMVHVFEKYHMPIEAEMSTVVSASAGIVGTVLMMFTVHRLGKRSLSLYCTAGSAAAALMLGTYAHVELGTDAIPQATWVPLALFVILYFCNSIQGQMPWMLLSEIFPFRTRGLSGGLSAAGCYVFLFLSTHLYLDIEKACQLQGAFWIYGSISVIGFVFLYFRLLETEGKSLEQIEDHFTRGLKPRTGK